MKKRLITLISLLSAVTLSAQEAPGSTPLIQNVYARQTQSLNGYWNYLMDQQEIGYYNYRNLPSPDGFFKDIRVDNVTTWKEYDFDSAPVMRVPGDWNTQKPELYNYEGTLWYKKKFPYRKSAGRVFLYFGAANYDTKVWVNGEKAGEHVGGFTPFNFEVTGLLREGENSVIVKVDNKRSLDAVPTVNFDWFNYGGLTRDVMLVEVPDRFIRTYRIQLEKGSDRTIAAEVRLSERKAGEKITVEIPELNVRRTASTGADGVAAFRIEASPALWSPETPKLYDVMIASETDRVADRIAFRTISTRGHQVLLNGKPVFLKGVCIHDEAPYGGGRIYSEDEAHILLKWAREMNCNFVRLAHYPHSEQMIREAERMGIMVWSEVPVYWTINWESPATFANAKNQLSEMIERDRNRGNIIIWSVANETPHSEARDKFLSGLIAYTRAQDDTRLVSLAMERHDISENEMTVQDNLHELVDVVSFNQYVGWYVGRNDKIDRVSWKIPYGKPIIVSKYGGECIAGYRSPDKKIWSEEYQAELYAKSAKMFDERLPGLAGTTPWLLKDYRSPRRVMPNMQDGYNRKGLVSEHGQKKQAFYVMQQWYKTK